MKLYYFEATQEYSTEGYILAEDEESAKEDAEELADPGVRDIWDSDFGVDIYVSEAVPSALKKGSYIWAGGSGGKDVNMEAALAILEDANANERPPECPGQEQFLV